MGIHSQHCKARHSCNFEMAQNLPSHLSQILYRIQPGLCLHTKADALLLSPKPTVETGKERVTAGANVRYSNTEFGICQECTCLHYPLTVECHRASAGEGEGEESMEISAVLLENH